MKVLVNVPNLEKTGGVAAYFSGMRRFLTDEVEYFTIGGPTSQEKPLALCRLLSDYRRFLITLGNNHPDVIHLNPSFRLKALLRDAVFLAFGKARRCKVLVFFHGWDHKLQRQIRKRWLWLFRMFYFLADGLIVLSRQFREDLLAMGFTGPIHCETTHVPDDAFDGVPSAALRRRNAEERFNILFLSRVEKEKGIFETLEAYARLRERYRQVSLTVAGDGTALVQVRQTAIRRRLSDVAFPGFVRGIQKENTFRGANCYLLPTYAEGMPLSVLEAMAYGLPVVTRPVGGIRDFFCDGEMGFLTESLDPAILAEKLEKLVLNPHLGRTMGVRNRAFAREHFAASQVAKRILSIYGGLESPAASTMAGR
jgi:glycosyltransferase involved in cell wall biosynthesis